MNKTIEEILYDFSWIDDSELGEDKFMGHHDIAKATKEIEALIAEAKNRVLEASLKELKEVHMENFMYKTLYGGILIPHANKEPSELLKEYTDLEPIRYKFADYVENHLDELKEQSK